MLNLRNKTFNLGKNEDRELDIAYSKLEEIKKFIDSSVNPMGVLPCRYDILAAIIKFGCR
jgi:hypothetical protein